MWCTFGHRSRTVWKERCSKKRPQIQCKTITVGKIYCMEKIHHTLYIWCTRYTLRQTWTTSSRLSFAYPHNSRYLSWLGNLICVYLKSQPVHSGILTFSSGSCHSTAPPTHNCSLSSYNTKASTILNKSVRATQVRPKIYNLELYKVTQIILLQKKITILLKRVQSRNRFIVKRKLKCRKGGNHYQSFNHKEILQSCLKSC